MDTDQVCPECNYRIKKSPDKKPAVLYKFMWHDNDCPMILRYYSNVGENTVVDPMPNSRNEIMQRLVTLTAAYEELVNRHENLLRRFNAYSHHYRENEEVL